MLDYPAFANGKFCKVQDLNISILDLGFIHSDATYDVIAVENGMIKNLEQHLYRFHSSCDGWKLSCPDMDELRALCVRLVQLAPSKDLLLWICVTRGIPRSGNPRDLANCENKLFAYAKPYFGFNPINKATICLANQQRNTAIDQRMKNFAWNDLNLAQWEAIDRGYNSAILLDNRGFLTEGVGFNVGIVKSNAVYAPKHNRLEGTVMAQVEKICKEQSILFYWAAISANDLQECDAMFLTSTAGNVIPVTKFESIEFKENAILKCLQNLIGEAI